MEDLTFGEQVKIILGRKGMTIKELAETIEAKTGKKMSRQNLTQRLGRDNFQEQDMRMIARILECPFQLSIMGTETARQTAEDMQEAAQNTAADARREENTESKSPEDRAEDGAVRPEEKLPEVQEAAGERAEQEAAPAAGTESAAAPAEQEPGEIRGAAETTENPDEIEETGAAAAAEQEAVEEKTAAAAADEVWAAPAEEQHSWNAAPAEEKNTWNASSAEQEDMWNSASSETEEAGAWAPSAEAESLHSDTEVGPDERDMTIGELYDIHEELSQLEENAKAGEPVEAIKEELEKPKRDWFHGNFFLRRRKKEEKKKQTEEPVYEAEQQAAPEPETYAEAQETEPQQEEAYREESYREETPDFEPVISHNDAEEDREAGDVNPYTGKEYQSNSVRMHPTRIGYVQVYDRSIHKWTDMTEWAFLGYQERKKALLGSAYEPPIYLD